MKVAPTIMDNSSGADMSKKEHPVPSSEHEQNDIAASSAHPLYPANQPSNSDIWGDDTIFGKRTSHPNRLLLTLLGDYWWRCTEHLPSAVLVALLNEFGISDVAARAALSRLVHHDLLVLSKHGRQTFYGLSKRAAYVLDDGTQRIFSFGEQGHVWDGMWSLVAFSIPEEQRKLRHVLRDRLRWLGFAPLYDGLWVSPHDRLSEVASQLTELSMSVVTMFRASIMEGTSEAGLPQHAWDLDALRIQYQQFIAKVQPLQTRIHHGSISPQDALIVRTHIMDIWRRFPTLDPDLPDVLLPLDWPRAHARQLFVETYDALGPLAQEHIQHVIAHYAPELAHYARYHTSNIHLAPELAT